MSQKVFLSGVCALGHADRKVAAVALFALLCVTPASAHHSFAMFDRTRMEDISGVVMDWQFTNPHSWLDIMQDSSGVHYEFETASINVLARLGLNGGTFKPGDKVAVRTWPLRDGRPGGVIVFVTTAGGKTYNTFPVPGGRQE